MKLTRSVSSNPALFTLVPGINVVFLLLIFLALSSTFVLQPGIPINLPMSAVSLAPQHNAAVVSIVASPQACIYFRDHRIAMEDLGAALNEGGVKDRTLIVKADRLTPYNLVVQVTNLGLRAGYAVVLATEERK